MNAKEYFLSGYNCAQAVLCAFSEEIGKSTEELSLIACGLGGGVSGLREICGAVNGMVIACDILKGKSSFTPKQKAAHYAFVRGLAEEFKAEVGSIRCGEILSGVGAEPSLRNDEYYKKRPCAELCELAESILRKHLSEEIQ